MMKFEYEFPTIRTLDDLLPAIEGRDEFVVAEKEGYTVVNYNVNFEDTFPPVKVTGGSAKMRAERALANALRRECRGIIFDTETRAIIRRPYHKFFNVNERDETLQNNVNLSNDHVILDKLDGSMIAPFMVGDNLIWGTKMGDTDVAKPVQTFVKNNPQYDEMAKWYIERGATPIFEWCSNKQRIVLDQPEDRLILTAIRNIETGTYTDHLWLEKNEKHFNIPVVKAFNFSNGIDDFVKHVHDMEDVEGFVVRFDGGHMTKLKCHWYVQIHKAKEAILQDRNIVQLILDNNLDDIKANVTDVERVRLSEFEKKILEAIANKVSAIELTAKTIHQSNVDRKRFALEHVPKLDKYDAQMLFRTFDGYSRESLCRDVMGTIRKTLSKTAKYEVLRDAWLQGVKYNAY